MHCTVGWVAKMEAKQQLNSAVPYSAKPKKIAEERKARKTVLTTLFEGTMRGGGSIAG